MLFESTTYTMMWPFELVNESSDQDVLSSNLGMLRNLFHAFNISRPIGLQMISTSNSTTAHRGDQ